MVDHSHFFNTLTSKLQGNCNFERTTGKTTYIHYRAMNGSEVQVNITTRFEPKNTVRIQMFSEACPHVVHKRVTTSEEAQMIEEALGKALTHSKNRQPKPSAVSHNNEFTYYVVMFPFTTEPMDVVDQVANTLITIFNVLEKK
jgi:hypothetical protein